MNPQRNSSPEPRRHRIRNRRPGVCSRRSRDPLVKPEKHRQTPRLVQRRAADPSFRPSPDAHLSVLRFSAVDLRSRLLWRLLRFRLRPRRRMPRPQQRPPWLRRRLLRLRPLPPRLRPRRQPRQHPRPLPRRLVRLLQRFPASALPSFLAVRVRKRSFPPARFRPRLNRDRFFRVLASHCRPM